MPTATYIALANYTVPSAAASVTFTSIPNTYRDLVLVISGEISDYDYIILRYNSDTGSNYPYVDMISDGGAKYSNAATLTGARVGRMSTTANSNVIAHIMDYSATDKHKTTFARGTSPDEMTIAVASRWANTNAIDTITARTLSAKNFDTNTTFALYGIVS